MLIAFLATAGSAETDAERARATFEKGVIAADSGRIDEAMIAYIGALKLDPTIIAANINLGVLYFQQNNFDKAIEMFEAAVKLEPKNVMALTNLGKTQARLKKYTEAELSMKGAIASDEKNPDLYKDLARVYREIDKFDQLQETIEKCHALGAADENTWYLLGLAQEKQKRPEDAIASYRKSLEVDPKGYDALSGLGKLYLNQQQYAEAAAAFKSAFDANNAKFRAMYNYCSTVETMNPTDYDGNIANWEQFVKIARNNPKASKEVAQSLAHIKELEEAKAAVAGH